GSGNPENSIKNEAVVGGFAPVRGADSEDEALKERPFLVRHKVSCQTGLHRRCQLESCSKPDVNPFCQHDLRHFAAGYHPAANSASLEETIVRTINPYRNRVRAEPHIDLVQSGRHDFSLCSFCRLQWS